MVNINIVRDNEGFIREYTVEGHAGADESGNDIVCASVSVIAYTGANALEVLAGIKLENTDALIIEDGYMKCVLPIDIDPDKKQTIKIILETMVIGFRQLIETPEYSEYISILDEEV
ncbi:MAG: ribosomal-processing cysteine protease Prp [Bacillota bacterium]|nr:ribosomal-processing cysteine protease Prp [Bacillota bacterium]